MLQTEFLRSLNCNYERVLLEQNPEEKRYQYCMLSRGGIKGLLSCSLRYINGMAYLYYDITSKQNVAQIYGKRAMSRQWVRDLIWSIQQIREELARFLLDEQNILWYPGQVFQDLESNIFSFVYVPYYVGDNGFGKLLEFMVEHIDYEDDKLVECVYKMYEQFELGGQDYLQSQIFRDAEMLEEAESPIVQDTPIVEMTEYLSQDITDTEEYYPVAKKQKPEKRKKRMGLFMSKRKKDKEAREDYRHTMEGAMAGYAVAEETVYEEEEWGKTIYIKEVPETTKRYGLYTPQGRVVAWLEKDNITIGKRREEADVVLEDISVSRMHARIFREVTEFYLEDLNSTNGTVKNGLPLQPYEKRKLEDEDEILIGKKLLIFREIG